METKMTRQYISIVIAYVRETICKNSCHQSRGVRDDLAPPVIREGLHDQCSVPLSSFSFSEASSSDDSNLVIPMNRSECTGTNHFVYHTASAFHVL